MSNSTDALSSEALSVGSARALPLHEAGRRESYWLFLVLGIGILFPWNAFVSAVDYFNALYPDLKPAFAFSSGYMLPNFLCFFPVMKWGKQFSFRARIAGPFVLYLVLLVLTPLIALQESLGKFAYFITLGFVVISGATDAVVQGALYGMAALFPGEHTAAVQTGTGIAGTLVVVLRMLTKAAYPASVEGLRDSAVVYFALCGSWMALCFFAYHRLHCLPFSKYHLSGGAVGIAGQNELELTTASSADDETPTSVSKHAAASIQLDSKSYRASLSVSYRHIFSNIWSLAALEGMQFLLSLAVYPGLLSTIPSGSWGLERSWLTLMLMLTFNICDGVGKTLPMYHRKMPSSRALWIGTVGRAFMLPLFIVAANGWLGSDDLLVVICAVFSGTNGYIACSALVLAPPRCVNSEKEVGGTIMVFALTIGLLAGVLLGDALIPLTEL